MKPIQWLLDRLGRRLLAWSAALAPDDPGEASAPPVVPTAAPFDAKRHWLDRVAHLPPQAWQQGGRPVQPRQPPARRAAPQREFQLRDAMQREAAPTAAIESPTPDAASAGQPAAAVQHDLRLPADVSIGSAGQDREPAAANAARSVGSAPVAPARAAPLSSAVRPAPLSPTLSPSIDAEPVTAEPASRRALPLPIGRERAAQAADRPPPERPARHEADSPTGAARAPTTRFEPPHAERAERRGEPRRAWPAPIAFEAGDAPLLDAADNEPSPASPVAGFDSRRSQAPELPQASSAPALSVSRHVPLPGPEAPLLARRIERRESAVALERDSLGRRWPDIPIWPATREPWARAADPHAHDRRQRLDNEQRG